MTSSPAATRLRNYSIVTSRGPTRTVNRSRIIRTAAIWFLSRMKPSTAWAAIGRGRPPSSKSSSTKRTRPPFRLHDNDWVLTSFLTAEEVTVSPLAQRARRRAQKQAYDAGVAVFTQRDARTLVTLELKIAQGPERSSPAEIEQAKEHVKRLRTKRAASRQEQTEHD